MRGGYQADEKEWKGVQYLGVYGFQIQKNLVCGKLNGGEVVRGLADETGPRMGRSYGLHGGGGEVLGAAGLAEDGETRVADEKIRAIGMTAPNTIIIILIDIFITL